MLAALALHKHRGTGLAHYPQRVQCTRKADSGSLQGAAVGLRQRLYDKMCQVMCLLDAADALLCRRTLAPAGYVAYCNVPAPWQRKGNSRSGNTGFRSLQAC